MKVTLNRVWKLTGKTLFKVLGDNIFLIEFENEWDKSRVLEFRPWIFEGNLFSVEAYNGNIAPSMMDFTRASFWIRMLHLPLACMCETMGFKIGSSVGGVEEVESEEDGMGWGEYLRVRINLDITKPLVRGRVLKLSNETTWVAFQYERLPKYCFHCGDIWHGVRGCASRQRSSAQEAPTGEQFGLWLRAPSGFRRTNFFSQSG